MKMDWTPIILLGGLAVGVYLLKDKIGNLFGGIGQGASDVIGGAWGDIFGRDYMPQSDVDAMFAKWAEHQGMTTVYNFEQTYLTTPPTDMQDPKDPPPPYYNPSPIKTMAGYKTALNLARATAIRAQTGGQDFPSNPAIQTAISQSNPVLAKLIAGQPSIKKVTAPPGAKIPVYPTGALRGVIDIMRRLEGAR